jgi:hypothetical protein
MFNKNTRQVDSPETLALWGRALSPPILDSTCLRRVGHAGTTNAAVEPLTRTQCARRASGDVTVTSRRLDVLLDLAGTVCILAGTHGDYMLMHGGMVSPAAGATI